MSKTTSYRKSLGLVELVSLGVGGTIGSGIFVVPGIAAKIMGPASLIAWLIVAVSASCVLMSLVFISRRLSSEGGFLPVFSSVFGVRVAGSLILVYIVSSIFGVSTIAAGIGQYISYFGQSQVLFIEIVLIIAFCGLNVIGISLAGMAENILTALKIIPLIVLSLLLVPYIRLENFVQTVPCTATGLLATIIIVYWPFTGFEISAIPVDEIRDPALVKRALLLVMLIVVAVYLILNIALIGSAGSQVLGASQAPLATAFGRVYANAGPFIAFIGIIAMLSALNAYIIGTSRVMQNFASRFSLPLMNGISHRGVPVFALLAGSGISAALLLISNHFEVLATVSVITTLIPYIFFCLTAWMLVTDISSRLISATGALSTVSILIIYFLI